MILKKWPTCGAILLSTLQRMETAYLNQLLFSFYKCHAVHVRILLSIQDDNADSLAERLRQLVVDEWQGKFCVDYLEFFIPNENADSSEAFIKEAERYRKKETFAGLLGDSVPLALANVLKIPLMILSTEHNVPFIDICPRTVLTGANAIFLAHYSAEAGHYNALIPLNQTTGYQDRQTIPETSSPSTTTVDVNTSDKLSCRCNPAKQKSLQTTELDATA